LIQEMLASKLDIIAKLSRKLPAKPGGIFPGNAMLAGAPGRAGALAFEQMGRNTDKGNIGA
jgi:hypothetical protein